MTSSTSQGIRRWIPARKPALVALALAGISIVAIGFAGSFGGGASGDFVYYTVERRDLEIDVTERGNLASQDEVQVICEVDDVEGDGIRGTPIVWIIPNGSYVEEGDLLVELDSASMTERLDRQVLDTERARSEQIQAQVKYENQRTQNQTSLAEAKLKVELAELALEQFEDEDGGTFQIDLQDIELQIQEAQASKLIEETNLEGVEELYKLGYRSSGELAQARLSALKSGRQLATALSRKKELVEYQYRKTRLELEGAVESARRSLEQVKRDNAALLAQAKAALDAANEALKKEEERLARYRDQIEKCKIYAPKSGLVAYATSTSRWYREEIRQGAAVRMRQAILTIPNLRRMQVETAVHETVLDQIEVGLPVSVRVDVFPDRSYAGTVQSVAVLPDEDQLAGSGTKVYKTIVTIDEDVTQLKPGMTAVCTIHVDLLEDVLCVPVQAVVQIGDETWCYVAGGGAPEKRPITLGRTNNKLVEVKSGLSEGDRVVLNPDHLVDWSRQPGREAKKPDRPDTGRQEEGPYPQPEGEPSAEEAPEEGKDATPPRRGSRERGRERSPGRSGAEVSGPGGGGGRGASGATSS